MFFKIKDISIFRRVKFFLVIFIYIFSINLDAIEGIDPVYNYEELIDDQFLIKKIFKNKTKEKEIDFSSSIFLKSEKSFLTEGFQFSKRDFSFNSEVKNESLFNRELQFSVSYKKHKLSFCDKKWNHKEGLHYKKIHLSNRFNFEKNLLEIDIQYTNSHILSPKIRSVFKLRNFLIENSFQLEYSFDSEINKNQFLSFSDCTFNLGKSIFIGIGINSFNNDNNISPTFRILLDKENWILKIQKSKEMNIYPFDSYFGQNQFLWNSQYNDNWEFAILNDVISGKLDFMMKKTHNIISMKNISMKDNWKYQWQDRKFEIVKTSDNNRYSNFAYEMSFRNFKCKYEFSDSKSHFVPEHSFEIKLKQRIFPFVYIEPAISLIENMRIDTKKIDTQTYSTNFLFYGFHGMNLSLKGSFLPEKINGSYKTYNYSVLLNVTYGRINESLY